MVVSVTVAADKAIDFALLLVLDLHLAFLFASEVLVELALLFGDMA